MPEFSKRNIDVMYGSYEAMANMPIFPVYVVKGRYLPPEISKFKNLCRVEQHAAHNTENAHDTKAAPSANGYC